MEPQTAPAKGTSQTVNIPNVDVPPVLGTRGTLTAEEIYNAQQKGLIADGKAPAQPSVTQMSVAKDSLPAQNITRGSEKVAEEETAEVDPVIDSVSDEVYDALVQNAQDLGIPQDQVAAYMKQEIGYMDGFETLEQYQEYAEKFNYLAEALERKYGDDVENVFTQMQERILDHGGEALLDRFQTDPAMLDPEIVMPYVEGGGYENPYDEYLGTAPTGRMVERGPDRAVGGGGRAPDLATVQNAINEHYSPANSAKRNTDEWNSRTLQLFGALRQAQQGAARGGFL